MPRYDFSSQRLFVDHDLTGGQRIEVDRAQANYLLNVLRLGPDDEILLFNARDGEWRARVEPEGRKKASLLVSEQTRPQSAASDLHLLFAPLKQARLDYMVQKAVEMGAGVLQPVLTQYTQNRALKAEKMRAHAIEAAEQCGILTLPDIVTPAPLETVLDGLDPSRHIIFCDENEEGQSPLDALSQIPAGPLAVLIGPEGGFSDKERAMLRARPNVTARSLGPRILRADTAAVAALALVQASLGDWRL